MPIAERNFPSSIELGETLTAIYLIPSIEGYTTGAINSGDPADAYRAEFSNAGDSHPEIEFPAVVSADSFRFDIAAMDARPHNALLGSGIFRVSNCRDVDQGRNTARPDLHTRNC